MRKRELQRIYNLYEKSLKKLEVMKKQYVKDLKEGLNNAGKKVIDEWYSDYIPNSYRRIYSLYKAFRVQVKSNGQYSVSFSYKYMSSFNHNSNTKKPINNEYIFDNSCLEGWHGGADKGPNHPFPGYPMYREPYPYYTNWYYIAEKSFSPYEQIMDEMNKTIEKVQNNFKKQYQAEILDKINAKISQLKGGV